ncbi:MAG: potassium-transporting ATPase subunit KdpB, partial [Vicinamibacterales bacterium]
MATQTRSMWDPQIVRRAIGDAFRKLHPRTMARNPVMFVVEIGSVLTTATLIQHVATGGGDLGFELQITFWLWLTVLFANFAEAMAEGRGKAQADTLRKAKTETLASRERAGGGLEQVAASALRKGDIVRVAAGEVIPGDGEIIEGVASVDESAITGESAPVIRESGGDRSAVTGGTKVLSDWIRVEVTANPGETFLDRMIALVEGAERQKTPNEIALNILLAGLTIVFLIAVVTLQPFAVYSNAPQSLFVLVSLLVCLIPTTIGGLLSAIGIAGMDRLVQHNVLAMSGRAVEAAGDVHTLLLDKTGTITLGNRQAAEFRPLPGISEERLADAAQLASLADETPEGRSIVVLAKEKYRLRGRELGSNQATFVAFTAQTRMSGVNFEGREIRKGAADAIEKYVLAAGGTIPEQLGALVQKIAREGGTPLVVAEDRHILGVIYLKDVVKGGMRERFAHLRAMGIRTVMITGDNPLTAAAIAAEAGVDDFLAQATPEDKMTLIKREQADGKLVAMTGDGTNDAPALAQADVGVAMNTGTQAAKEAGNMVDLDSNPTKLIEVVEIGKQLLITRGALTTFS